MAAKTAVTSYEALLELEKSSHSLPKEHLKEAARIIGADLEAYSQNQTFQKASINDIQTIAAPKEEWVLRWLMKKLKVQTSEPKSNYKIEGYSWALLSILLDRIPSRTLATVLTEGKFPNILQNSLEELGSLIQQCSETTVQDGTQSDPSASSGSRKRKRTEAVAKVRPSELAFTALSSPVEAFLSLLRAVRQLLALGDRLPSSQAAVRSHVKLVLRGDPVIAANLLSQGFRNATVVDILIKNNGGHDIERLCSVLLSLLDIWKVRLDRAEDDANGLFASKVLEPALKLIVTMRKQTLESDIANSLVQGIERLIVLHVVLPVRGVFFASTAQGSTTADKGASPKQVNTITAELNTRLGSILAGPTSDLLPALLDIAIRALPRDTFRRQVNEAPWLEILFVVLSARAGYHLPSGSASDVPANLGVLQDLFQVAIKRKMTLSLDTLMQYAIRVSGLHRNFKAEVQWKLISQIIQIGIDVFLPNSGLEESIYLLDSLISHVTTLSQLTNGTSGDNYNLLKENIVIPLLKGFFGARDSDTFLRIWIDQLRILDKARSNDSTIPFFSVWEDDDVSQEYGKLLTKNLSPSLIGSRIDEIISALSSPEETSTVYANIVILDSILLSGQENTAKLLQTISRQRTLDGLVALQTSFLESYWRWRLWRVMESLVHSVDSADQILLRTLTGSVLPAAKKIVERFPQVARNSSGTAQCQEAFWCFRLLASVIGEVEPPTSGEYLDKMAGVLVFLLDDVPDSTDAAWNGGVGTITSPDIVAVACLTTLLARGSTLGLISTEARRQLFTTLLSAVTKTGRGQECLANGLPSSKVLNAQLIEIWFGFASPEFLLASTKVVYDMTSVLYEELKECKGDLRLLTQSLLNIPVRLIPRHQRGSIIDLLEETVVREKLSSDTELDMLTLITRLVAAPKAPAKITNDVTAIWELARSISLHDSEVDRNTFHAFKQLHKTVIDKVLISADGSLGDYGQKTYDEVSRLEKTPKLPDFDTLEYYLLTLSLASLHTHQPEFEDNKRKSIQNFRKNVLKSMLSEIKSFSRKLKKGTSELDVKYLTGILGVADTLVDLLHGDEDTLEILRKFEKYANSSDIDETVKRTVKRRILAYKPASSDISKTLLDYSSLVSIQQLQARDQELFVYKIHSQLSSLTKDELIGFLRDTRTSGLSGEQAAYRLLLIGMAIGLLDPIVDRESPASLELTSIFTDVSESLSLCSSIEPFCLAAEALDILLRTQPRSVSQWNIDNMIAKLAIIVSPAGPKIPSSYAGAVYTRLCRLLGTLFGLYRKKLSGRFHLILPVIQQLLRCLFTGNPTTSAKSSSLAATQPPWIESKAATPLQVEHAGHYTRLLTSICDPTVSSVELQRGGSNQGLSDNTKKVKSLSGQYLQYVIMEYANSQLRGHMVPEMKTALMPGLYAVLDIMSKDTMRGMNAAMDSSARAVFKRLYEDYVKFGKWNHD